MSRRAAASITASITLAALLSISGCGDDHPSNHPSSSHSETPVVSPSEDPSKAASEADPTYTSEGEATPEVAVGEPERLVIESIDVDADLTGVGLNDDGSMQTPEYHTNTAGWYTPGPPPGAPGPAVIAAHVDGPNGTDVFYDLDDIATGDEIVVFDDDGGEFVFVVERLATADKDELPYDEIWPQDTDDTLLTLITCDGPYVDGEYEDNLIVYATAEETR